MHVRQFAVQSVWLELAKWNGMLCCEVGCCCLFVCACCVLCALLSYLYFIPAAVVFLGACPCICIDFCL